MNAADALRAVKLIHTIVWIVFASCILVIPVFAVLGDYRLAALLSVIVLVEVLVLVFNQWQCPLTPIAARYTNDRRANFDIYLPEWLARHNKLIFGIAYVAGLLFALARWARWL
jgi:polyferredoxin